MDIVQLSPLEVCGHRHGFLQLVDDFVNRWSQVSNFSGCGVVVSGRCIPVPIVYSDHTMDGAHRTSPASVYTSSTRYGYEVLTFLALSGRDALTAEIRVPNLPFPGPLLTMKLHMYTHTRKAMLPTRRG
jgi:hypothetical protein